MAPSRGETTRSAVQGQGEASGPEPEPPPPSITTIPMPGDVEDELKQLIVRKYAAKILECQDANRGRAPQGYVKALMEGVNRVAPNITRDAANDEVRRMKRARAAARPPVPPQEEAQEAGAIDGGEGRRAARAVSPFPPSSLNSNTMPASDTSVDLVHVLLVHHQARRCSDQMCHHFGRQAARRFPSRSGHFDGRLGINGNTDITASALRRSAARRSRLYRQ